MSQLMLTVGFKSNGPAMRRTHVSKDKEQRRPIGNGGPRWSEAFGVPNVPTHAGGWIKIQRLAARFSQKVKGAVGFNLDGSD